MAGPLVVCPACSTHVLVRDSECPHCGTSLRSEKGTVFARTATAMLMGLALAGCPADDDDTQDTMGGSGSSSSTTDPSAGSVGSMSSSGTSATDPTDPSATTIDDDSTSSTFGEVQSAYGSPDTETFGSTDITDSDSTSSGGDTDTDTEGSGSTTLSPLYGAVPSD